MSEPTACSGDLTPRPSPAACAPAVVETSPPHQPCRSHQSLKRRCSGSMSSWWNCRPDRLEAALERVGSAKTLDREVTLNGTFRGATLDSWRFDFRTGDDAAGEVISGRIAEEVADEDVTAMIQPTTNTKPKSGNDCPRNTRNTLKTRRLARSWHSPKR